MPYDYDRLFSVIVNAVQTDDSLEARMVMVVGECQVQRPHADWDRLKSLDFEADAGAIGEWLNSALSGPSFNDHSYEGIWFGLCNPRRGGVATADIYASAALRYTPPNLDWATTPTYIPGRSDLRSVVLNSIYDIAYDAKEGLGNDAEYPLALAYGAMAACEALRQLKLTGHLCNLKGAACGFDSGDFLFLGAFDHGCFVKHTVAG